MLMAEAQLRPNVGSDLLNREVRRASQRGAAKKCIHFLCGTFALPATSAVYGELLERETNLKPGKGPAYFIALPGGFEEIQALR